MGSSEFTPYYWQHKCPAASPQDGDDIPEAPNHQNDMNLKYDKTPFLARSFRMVPLLNQISFKGKSILGKKCSVDGCDYVVNEETVILNGKKVPIRNVGGKNLHRDRMTALWMRCCICKNSNTTGHSINISTHREPGSHTCKHTLDYISDLQNPKFIDRNDRYIGCNCVMVNEAGDGLAYWRPYSGIDPPELYPGGPLDLDTKYHKKRQGEAK
jgi:hypothetical protein